MVRLSHDIAGCHSPLPAAEAEYDVCATYAPEKGLYSFYDQHKEKHQKQTAIALLLKSAGMQTQAYKTGFGRGLPSPDHCTSIARNIGALVSI